MALDVSPVTPGRALILRALDSQKELSDLSIQQATGRKNLDFAGYAEDGTLERYVSIEASRGDIQDFVRSNTLAISRVDTQILTLDNLQNIAIELNTTIINRRNDAAEDALPFQQLVNTLLGSIENALNSKSDGKYIFSGAKTNVEPVPNINSSNLGTDNLPTSVYYNGDNTKAVVRSSANQDIEYGVLANEPAFQKLIGAAHLALQADLEDNDALLADAIDLIDEAGKEITALSTSQLETRNTLENINITHADADNLLNDVEIEISATNVVEVETKIAQLDVILQASFSAYNRVSSLKLVNFLN